MAVFRKINLKTFQTRGFNLTPVEFKDVVPFVIKRLYYFDSFKPADKTGAHCHKIEEEFFIQAKGASTAIIDQGQGIEEISLQPGEAIYLLPTITPIEATTLKIMMNFCDYVRSI